MIISIPQSQPLPPDTSHLVWVFLQDFLSQQPVVKQWELGTKAIRKAGGTVVSHSELKSSESLADGSEHDAEQCIAP